MPPKSNLMICFFGGVLWHFARDVKKKKKSRPKFRPKSRLKIQNLVPNRAKSRPKFVFARYIQVSDSEDSDDSTIVPEGSTEENAAGSGQQASGQQAIRGQQKEKKINANVRKSKEKKRKNFRLDVDGTHLIIIFPVSLFTIIGRFWQASSSSILSCIVQEVVLVGIEFWESLEALHARTSVESVWLIVCQPVYEYVWGEDVGVPRWARPYILQSDLDGKLRKIVFSDVIQQILFAATTANVGATSQDLARQHSHTLRTDCGKYGESFIVMDWNTH